MQTATLKLETLHLLSGELAADVDEHLKAATGDCRKHVAIAKPRVVTIELHITPSKNDDDDVVIETRTKLKMPVRPIPAITARRSRQDQLQFDFDEADQ